MPEFYDFCLRETNKSIEDLASELGWTATNCNFNTEFLKAEDWGELKRKIRNSRDNTDFLIFLGGDEELNRKAASDNRVDVILHPEKGRKDSGMDHVLAKQARENQVAIGFDFQQLQTNRKKQSHILKHWKRNLKLCQKYDTPYIITSGATEKWGLRSPRDLASIIISLDYPGKKAVSEYPEKIVERREKSKDANFIQPGLEKEE